MLQSQQLRYVNAAYREPTTNLDDVTYGLVAWHWHRTCARYDLDTERRCVQCILCGGDWRALLLTAPPACVTGVDLAVMDQAGEVMVIEGTHSTARDLALVLATARRHGNPIGALSVVILREPRLGVIVDNPRYCLRPTSTELAHARALWLASTPTAAARWEPA